MKPSRFTEEQIIGILREHEAGAKTADVCRKHGISSATFYISGRASTAWVERDGGGVGLVRVVVWLKGIGNWVASGETRDLARANAELISAS